MDVLGEWNHSKNTIESNSQQQCLKLQLLVGIIENTILKAIHNTLMFENESLGIIVKYILKAITTVHRNRILMYSWAS